MISDAGGRGANQDVAEIIEPDQLHAGYPGCWILADGLGGHGGGERAARIAVDAAIQTYKKRPSLLLETVEACINNAQEAILSQQLQNERFNRMRTTIVVLIARDDKAMWAHVGDTRLYLFRYDQVQEKMCIIRTRDHSVPQVLVEAGAINEKDIRYHSDRNRLLQCLGGEEELKPTYSEEELLNHGDAFLLCTDGFWEYISELEMEIDLSKSTTAEEWLSNMLVRFASNSAANPENDNYSAVAVFVS